MTLRDLAEKAGVSVATVSRVLNDTGEVPLSPTVRDRVMKAIAETGFEVGRRQRRKPAAGTSGAAEPEFRLGHMVAGVEHKFGSPYVSGIMRGMEQEIQRTGLGLCFQQPALFAFQDLAQFHQTLMSARLDGIIMIGQPPEEYVSHMLALVPHLVLGSDFQFISPMPENDGVGFSHEEAAEKAIAHLIGLGHRDIGFVGERHTDRRYPGFVRAMAAAGLPVRPEWLQQCSFELTAGYEEMKTLLRADRLPTAVFAACDSIAIGALRAIHEAGLRVPDDISIIGVDDIEWGQFSSPQLTTMRVPKEEIGRWAVRLLLARVRGELTVPAKVVVPTELVVRRSTAPPRSF